MATPVVHGSFSLERHFDAPPSRVFQAFADPAQKSRWFQGPPEWGQDEQTLDFRVGGRETSVGGPPGGPLIAMAGTYVDIVPDERIITTYEMAADGVRISVSLATFELVPEDGGTRLFLTEHGAYLDGVEGEEANAGRRRGTADLLDQLAAYLASDVTSAAS